MKLTLLLGSLCWIVSGQTDIETEGAIAYFSNHGIDGTVVVINGHIVLNLTITSGFNIDNIGGDECFEGGLHWGIYDEWNHADFDDQLGASDCGVDQTGRRWDPYYACSPASGNDYCTTNDECVPPSNYKGTLADEYEYVCNPYAYEYDPFKCEMGDMSGKYGLLYLDGYDSDHNGDYHIEYDFKSYWEAESYDLGGKSIVFRCHDTSRAFCSAFQEYEPTDDELETFLRPCSNYTETMSQKAEVGDSGNSYVLLTYYQMYQIIIDSSDLNVPGDCGDYIYYRIFSTWEETGIDCEEKTGDTFYDPTLVCAKNSDADTENNGLGWCDEGELCGKNSFSYECTDYYSDPVGRINCAPGDLSAKYGSIDISENVNFFFNITGYDAKMMPMSKVLGKSIVFQCSSDWAIIDCAPFYNYDGDIGITDCGGQTGIGNNNNNNNNNEENSSNNDDENTFLGVSNTVVLIMLILALASIVPCIRSCRNRKAGAASGASDDMYETDARDFGKKSNNKSGGITGKFKSAFGGKNTNDDNGNVKRVQSRSNLRQQSQSSQYGGDGHMRQDSTYSQSGDRGDTGGGVTYSSGYGGTKIKTKQARTMPSMQSGMVM